MILVGNVREILFREDIKVIFLCGGYFIWSIEFSFIYYNLNEKDIVELRII